ncbi:MAG: indolepyruvate ferredoxin oxidoreductase subunit alpha [Candidatus Ranarchaeia archaeon]
MISDLGSEKKGLRVLATGNEAIARGAIEAGVKVAAAYPGTPSSEILATLARFSKQFGYHAEWSINEKVAFEVAAGAAFTGVRSIASMKHVGLNVAMDALMSVNQTGVKGGMVLAIAGDPSCHSSQNEQDTRYLAKFSELPMLEPSSIQEAKDFTKEAFKVSEETELPVFIRTLTRLSHSRGDLILGEIKESNIEPHFEKGRRWGMFAGVSRFRHQWRHDRDNLVASIVHKTQYNNLDVPKEPILGIIGGGIAFTYAKEAISILGLENKIATLKVGTPFPPPLKDIKKLLDKTEKILVVEEIEPFLEEYVIQTAYQNEKQSKIFGKLSKHIPKYWELNAKIVTQAISKILGIEFQKEDMERKQILEKSKSLVINRPLTMCIGCPHRATFYALRKAIRSVSKGKAIISGDIGCYALGWSPPWFMQDTILCMGASIGIGQGMVHAGVKVPVIATIGDSTTLHSGLTSLISANYNKSKLVILIMDNSITAMTGFQPHPATGITAIGESTVKADIQKLVEASNIDFLRIVDPYDTEQTYKALSDAINHDKTSVVISRRECALLAERDRKIAGKPRQVYYVDEEKCTFCKVCLTQVNCPAISIRGEKSYINPLECIGCGLCAYACTFGAILKKED